MYTRTSFRLVAPAVLLLPVLSLAACGDSDTGPEQAPLVVAEAGTDSGNEQEGTVGEALDRPLVVVVTRDGDPVEGVAVQWETGDDGVMSPEESLTDDQGLATSEWTLGPAAGEQRATATVSNAQGSPVEFVATANEVELPPGPRVDLENSAFVPANATVAAGETVTWVWPAGSLPHNVVPDDGSTPSGSGVPRTGPLTYSFTFTIPGVYRYYCSVHGAPGGVGMSGTVTVLEELP